MEQDALLMVDIQNDYFPGGKMALDGMEAAAKNAQRVLKFFRAQKKPVFHIQHISNRPGAIFFLPDTAGAEIHERVTPEAGEAIIQKHFPNCFRETSLQAQLNTLDIEALTICGAMSHMCIDATTRAAADLGFQCTVVHDACATKDLTFDGKTVPADMVHGAFMAALQPVYAKVMDLGSFLHG